ncbi:MAG: hypothetical protein ACHQK8_04495, partial [Bacteroidia bacterium]
MNTASYIINILVIIGLPLLWIYLKKFSESIAERASEKSLKKFQSSLDKELVKFETTRIKQIDAIQDTYKKFNDLTTLVE